MLKSKFINRLLVGLCALVLSASTLFAQSSTVTGTVTDKNGEPLAGVYVLVQGTRNGASTDVDGNYRITAPSNATLVFSAMGYKDETVAVGGRSKVNVTLSDDALMLEETVVTALGIKKDRKALGYSVAEVNSSELLKNKQTNIINSLAGKVAGVNVTQSSGAAGAGSSIIIRGGNSASESRDNQPLFVVDGIIYDNSTVNGGNSGTDGVTKSATSFSNRVMDINPEDVESMSILKGAAAAALYGSRAADGAIIITTKKGAEGSAKVNVSSKFTYATISSAPEIQDVYGRGSYDINGVFTDQLVTSSWGNKITGKIYDNVADFFQGASTWDNSVSISGGHKNGNYYLSVSNYNQTGVVPGTGYDKTTVRFNGEQKYGKLTVGSNVSYTYAKTTKTLTTSGLYDGGGNGTMTALYGWSRDENMSHWLNEDGTKYRMFEGLQSLEDDVENPYWIINKNKLTDDNARITGAVTATYDVTDWLNISYRAGLDKYTNDSYTYIAPGGAVNEKYQQGRLSKSKVDYQYLTSNLMANAHKTFGDFDMNLLLGTTAEATQRVGQSQWGYEFVTEGTISFGNILKENKYFSENTTRKRLVGAYGEYRLSYKNIAYLTLTGRNDWSSTLPVDNRSYFYPSVSGSFVFTELMPKNDVLSFGKVRASWAKAGKDASAYATNTYLWDAQIVNGSTVGIGNSWTGGSPYLKPEMQTSWEVGTELKFFGGRLGVDYTYYNSKTTNQIAAPRLAQSTGYIFLTLNSGSVRNKGMELMVTARPIEKRDFTWDITFNFAGNRGTLGSDFIDGVDIFYVTDTQIGGVKAASVPGGNFLALTGNYWLHENKTRTIIGADGKEVEEKYEDMNGRYQVDPTTGLYKLQGSTTNIVGNREPKFTGGISNDFRYKNLTVSALLDVRVGGDIYNGTQNYLTARGQSMRTLDRDHITVSGVASADGTFNGQSYKAGDEISVTYNRGESYQINGTTRSGEYMIQSYWSNYCSNAYNFIENVNWIRLRSLTLTYDFASLLKKQNFVKGLTVTATGGNLFCLTNFKGGLDPEAAAVGSGTGGSGSVGIEYCGVPSQRTFSLGVNLTF